MQLKGALKSLLMTILYLVIYIVFAIVYFVVVLFVIDFAAGLVMEDALSANFAVLSAVILTAATLIGGGAISYFGDDE